MSRRTEHLTDEFGGVEVAAGYAQLLADADRPGGWLLLIDRVRQSYVDLACPTYLDLEYVQHFGYVLDALPPGEVAITHIGGGAFCFPRYVEALRPGSSQIVLEPDETLTAFIRSRLPFARGSRIRVRPQGGREGIAALRDASADVVVLDAFAGARVPAELSTAEFFADVARVLRPEGVLIANIADGPPLAYAAGVLAAVGEVLPERVVIADPAVTKRRRFGNVVFAASRAPLPVDALRRYAAAAPFPLQVIGSTEVGRWIGGVAALTDATAMRSPAPPGESWRAEVE